MTTGIPNTMYRFMDLSPDFQTKAAGVLEETEGMLAFLMKQREELFAIPQMLRDEDEIKKKQEAKLAAQLKKRSTISASVNAKPITRRPRRAGSSQGTSLADKLRQSKEQGVSLSSVMTEPVLCLPLSSLTSPLQFPSHHAQKGLPDLKRTAGFYARSLDDNECAAPVIESILTSQSNISSDRNSVTSGLGVSETQNITDVEATGPKVDKSAPMAPEQQAPTEPPPPKKKKKKKKAAALVVAEAKPVEPEIAPPAEAVTKITDTPRLDNEQQPAEVKLKKKKKKKKKVVVPVEEAAVAEEAVAKPAEAEPVAPVPEETPKKKKKKKKPAAAAETSQ